jgi:hypothetical protein
MVLIDKDIKGTDNTGPNKTGKNLICEGFVEANLFSCGYRLGIGQIFEPGTGKQLMKDDFVGLKIPPNGTAIVMTKEKVKMPGNIYGAYYPTFELAQHGILMLNAAIVEPGYEGYLSCYFVNFSSETFCLTKDKSIAKIVFNELSGMPDAGKINALTLDEDKYKRSLFTQANKFSKSFLDINGLGEKISEKTEKSVKNSIIFGGIVVAFLLFYSSLEPLVTKYVWGTSPAYEQRMDALQSAITKNIELNKSLEEQSKALREEQKTLDSLEKVRISELSKPVSPAANGHK